MQFHTLTHMVCHTLCGGTVHNVASARARKLRICQRARGACALMLCGSCGLTMETCVWHGCHHNEMEKFERSILMEHVHGANCLIHTLIFISNICLAKWCIAESNVRFARVAITLYIECVDTPPPDGRLRPLSTTHKKYPHWCGRGHTRQ